ncbi:AAA family ATPase [Bradyrhizobium sp. CW9]|uniref:ATP-binding protein n=1 Tax=Bradyrhizobium sp. CW9 TaxID=2782689 RepID=UPI001FFAD2B8|nr:ATP-binding protein [Bradyrhizobium sp. CW9]MCK1332780.1 AAA family ATPase [Bradyrhizobium sp. CW9]
MIQIEEIEIVEFRGIRHLKRSLGRRSFGIAGPNGTGKSGIVDAIEFALTGNITRLGGAGTAELSVKAHAPHVDASKKPETALVRLQVYAPALKKSFIIERSVKNPGAAVLKPSSAETRALLAQLETHPEFALSRREIIKYILVPAGKRSQYVQELLRLDQLEKLRVSLQRVANDAKRDHGRAEVEDRRSKSDFFHHLGIATPNKTDLLASVNARRAVLKLDPVADLAPENALKVGINPDAEHEASQPFSKLGAKNDLASFLKRLAVSQEITITGAKSDAVGALAQLTDDPALLRVVKQRALVERGLELVECDACPLCDGPWEMALLATHLQEKIAKADAASTALKQLALAIDPLAAHLRAMALDAGKVAEWCEKANPPIDAASLRSHAKGPRR